MDFVPRSLLANVLSSLCSPALPRDRTVAFAAYPGVGLDFPAGFCRGLISRRDTDMVVPRQTCTQMLHFPRLPRTAEHAVGEHSARRGVVASSRPGLGRVGAADDLATSRA
jgi:hypothetical protein